MAFQQEPLDRETLEARRRESRQMRARRRRVLAGAVLLALVAGAGVVLASGGSGSRTAHGGPARTSAASSVAAVNGGRASGTAEQPTTGAALTRPSAGSGHAPGNQAVPILMYHVIAAPPAGAPFPGLYVDPQEFREQMQALQRAGWHAVTQDQLAAYWQHGAPIGTGKPIVLSFDNGYHSQYSQALPVLRSLGWVGVENIQLSGLPPSQGGLSATEVRALVAAGWELDTQGLNHADLITLGPAALREQVAGTRATLRARYHVPVNWFCYPSGHYDPTVVDAVRAAGYTGATTVVPGWAHRGDDGYRLHRLRVLGGTSGPQLISLIEDTRGDPSAPTSYGGA